MLFTSPRALLGVAFALTLSSMAHAHYMDIVGEWRQRMGLHQLIYNANLEQNARKTVIEGNGQMVHQLNPGTSAQVLAPGGPSDDEFRHVFVGGWLCELPDAPGMNGICATEGQGWVHTTTGHAEILRDTRYQTIGCANAVGIWSCDLGL